MDTANIVEIFCIFDEFCKYFDIQLKKHVIEGTNKRHLNRKGRMSDSEIMTILVMFRTSHFRDLKTFYLSYICQHMKKDYPKRISYNRFVECQTNALGFSIVSEVIIMTKDECWVIRYQEVTIPEKRCHI